MHFVQQCSISDCGEYKPGDDLGLCDVKGEDVYPNFPEDSMLDLGDADKVLAAAAAIKAVGNEFFKSGDYTEATIRYKKALRYLNALTSTNDDSDHGKQLKELKLQCLLNRYHPLCELA